MAMAVKSHSNIVTHWCDICDLFFCCFFLEHRVLVRRSEPHRIPEGCVFCTAEPDQFLPDRLRSQQFATVLPEQSGEHQRKGEHDGAGRD